PLPDHAHPPVKLNNQDGIIKARPGGRWRSMQIGMVGLGRMGGNMAERLRRGGHDVVGFDRDPSASDVASLKELVERLRAPRVVWVMVPAGAPTQQVVDDLGELLSEGDLVVDGGNAHYVDDQRHAEELARKGGG